MNAITIKGWVTLNLLMISLGWSTDAFSQKRKRITVDKTLAIIYHPQGSTVILQSDLRPDLSDQVPLLRDVILKELIVIDSCKYKITVSEAEVDRHLSRIQESLKKSREDLIEFFKERGYSFEEARKELEKSLLIETTIGERVRRSAVVSEGEIEKYYRENLPVDYTIKQSFVPFGMGSKAITRATIDSQIEAGEILQAVSWSDPITLKETDIAQEKSHIKELSPGTVSRVQESDDGITLLQLVSKGKTPYEQAKKQITMDLGAKKQKFALDDYYDSLMSNARIRFFDKNSKIEKRGTLR